MPLSPLVGHWHLSGMMFIMPNHAGHIGFTLHLSSPGSTKYLAWSYVRACTDVLLDNKMQILAQAAGAINAAPPTARAMSSSSPPLSSWIAPC